MQLTEELREKTLQELHWLLFILEGDLRAGGWTTSTFAARVRERALESALVIEGLAEPLKRDGGSDRGKVSLEI